MVLNNIKSNNLRCLYINLLTHVNVLYCLTNEIVEYVLVLISNRKYENAQKL
jgi:hypothetical protein